MCEKPPLNKSCRNGSVVSGIPSRRLLNHIDINPQNVFTLEGTVPQDRVQESCRLYEQRIQSFGGIDIMLLGIGRIGNIAINEPGSSLTSSSRLILIDSLTREEMSMSQSTNETVPPCAVTMGISTILKARQIFLTAWGEEKAAIIQKCASRRMTPSRARCARSPRIRA